MIIVLPKEIKNHEYRVALLPVGVEAVEGRLAGRARYLWLAKGLERDAAAQALLTVQQPTPSSLGSDDLESAGTWSAYLAISGPLFLVGVLFFVGWRFREQIRVKEG